jgi:hypothetical protein
MRAGPEQFVAIVGAIVFLCSSWNCPLTFGANKIVKLFGCHNHSVVAAWSGFGQEIEHFCRNNTQFKKDSQFSGRVSPTSLMRFVASA